jgi:hypothetical protein
VPFQQRVRRLIAVLGSASIVAVGGAHAAEPARDPVSPAIAGDRPATSAGAEDGSALIEATPGQKPPITIELSADHQGYDLLADRFVAVGNVKVLLAGGRLLADRLEYESATRTVYASGRVRFQRGKQYLQASRLRYSLLENSGEVEEVYGVLDFDSAALDLNPAKRPTAALLPLSHWPDVGAAFQAAPAFSTSALPAAKTEATADALLSKPLSSETAVAVPPGSAEALPDEDWRMPPVALTPAAQTMACPPPLPAIPDWHPHPWSASMWGGQMIDANFGDTFLFKGRLRPEYLGGVGLNKRLVQAGPFALEFDSNALLHQATEQEGGPFNQDVPNNNTGAQTFGEFTWSFGVRAWLQPWLNLAFFEGVSLNSEFSNYEKTFRENYATFLNYLGFEVEALIQPQWSLVGRIHHRSGAYGTYSSVNEGSNAYLMGMRYRFGSSPAPSFRVAMTPPNGCSGGDQPQPKPLSEQLNQVAMGSSRQALATAAAPAAPSSTLPPAEQELLRREALSAVVDQRVEGLQYKGSLRLQRQAGGNSNDESVGARQVKYGDVRPWQLQPLTQRNNRQLVSGTISRWRMQANRLTVTPQGWEADRVAFSNDPYTPAQSWVDASGVVAHQEPNGDLVIEAKRNQLILEDRLPIPLKNNQRFEKEREVQNRWSIAVDSEDRDGLYLSYEMKPIEIGQRGSLQLEPQFMVRRALDGVTSSYVLPGQPIGDSPSSQPARIGDLFGLLARFDTRVLGVDVEVTGDFSTLDPSNFANGTRSWGDIRRSFKLPGIGRITARGFAAYRYRVWNGSLGEQDVYSAIGGSLEQARQLPNLGAISNVIYWRAGVGNFQGAEFETTNLTDLWRASAYASINSSLPLWTGTPHTPVTEASSRFTPKPVVPGLSLESNISMDLAYYSDGFSQQAFSVSGGPTLTLGHLQKNVLDYTQVSVTGGGTLLQGSSPFSFDRIVDLSTLGVGLTQQLIGPLMFSGGVGLNVDPNSPFFGDVVDSYVELRWQRRAYEVGLFYSPYQGIGGVRVKLNDFKFSGTGLPFVPYTAPAMAKNARLQRGGF